MYHPLRADNICKQKISLAFTLVELLVVVSIIGLLVGLLAAGIPLAIEKGMKAKAKGEATAIVAAIKAYKQEYGKFPGDVSVANRLFSSNSSPDTISSLMQVLSGDATATLNNEIANPKGVRFFEGADTNGTMLDPWGGQYLVLVDSSETGSVTYTYAGSAVNLRISVLAVCYGSDGKADTASGKKNDIFSTDLK
ncbi:MAG: type II secretion system protein [Proteobacteria bacterium]|nr:type II secretion system protein [Pseudomonadota bacterium]NBS49985.1 type II secretion system protein [Verrucomicrobiota bacterium]NBT24186.1 type II secretion system protein [bacterium]NBV97308.1 type II secretion system protein [Verrucomicrobiota bacterium]